MLKGDEEGENGKGSTCLQTSTSLLSCTGSAPAHTLGKLHMQRLDFKDEAHTDHVNNRSYHLLSFYHFVNAYYILSRQTSL